MSDIQFEGMSSEDSIVKSVVSFVERHYDFWRAPMPYVGVSRKYAHEIRSRYGAKVRLADYFQAMSDAGFLKLFTTPSGSYCFMCNRHLEDCRIGENAEMEVGVVRAFDADPFTKQSRRSKNV